MRRKSEGVASEALARQNHEEDDAVAETLSKTLNVPRVRIDTTTIEAAAIGSVPGSLARRHTCLPIRIAGRTLVLAMANPLDSIAINDVQFVSSRPVEPVVAAKNEILTGINRCYPSSAERAVSVFARESAALDQTASADTSVVVELCTQIILDAIDAGASDIHIEVGPSETRVRLRVDGVLHDYLQIPGWLRGSLLSRIKVLAKLDIAEQRVPQDGRIQHKTQDQTIDLRVSTLPTQFGEKVVLRLLRSTSSPTLSTLGFSPEGMTLVEDGLNQPQGLIIVTGPTGSGKSTTLHAMLAQRQSTEINVVTIEDPIEYQLAGANQVQVNPKAGVTFASSLRAILRQDPDVIMVGEIRDQETAEIAFHAALTGHLVLTSLHTNSSLAAIARLFELGVKAPTISAATNVIIAQRLARRICAHCWEPYTPAAAALRKLRLDDVSWTFVHGKGCDACRHAGYSGRLGIYEILRLTPALKDVVNGAVTERRLKRVATNAGVRFLLDDALAKVREGLTTIEEILRVIRVDRDDTAGGESLGHQSDEEDSGGGRFGVIRETSAEIDCITLHKRFRHADNSFRSCKRGTQRMTGGKYE